MRHATDPFTKCDSEPLQREIPQAQRYGFEEEPIDHQTASVDLSCCSVADLLRADESKIGIYSRENSWKQTDMAPTKREELQGTSSSIQEAQEPAVHLEGIFCKERYPRLDQKALCQQSWPLGVDVSSDLANNESLGISTCTVGLKRSLSSQILVTSGNNNGFQE